MNYFYIIAGCNGAGKTTASYHILPDLLQCREFINADEIAKGLSPFQPEKVSIQAGKMMLKRVDQLFLQKANFAVETTLATHCYQNRIVMAQQNDYVVILLFLWINNINLAKERVRLRVKQGGHFIADDVIERRYMRGIKNLFHLYLPICDRTLLFDNSYQQIQIIFIKNQTMDIVNIEKYQEIRSFYDRYRKI